MNEQNGIGEGAYCKLQTRNEGLRVVKVLQLCDLASSAGPESARFTTADIQPVEGFDLRPFRVSFDRLVPIHPLEQLGWAEKEDST